MSFEGNVDCLDEDFTNEQVVSMLHVPAFELRSRTGELNMFSHHIRNDPECDDFAVLYRVATTAIYQHYDRINKSILYGAQLRRCDIIAEFKRSITDTVQAKTDVILWKDAYDVQHMSQCPPPHPPETMYINKMNIDPSVDVLVVEEKWTQIHQDIVHATCNEITLLGACLRMIRTYRGAIGCGDGGINIDRHTLQTIYGLPLSVPLHTERVGRLIGARGYAVDMFNDGVNYYYVWWTPPTPVTRKDTTVISTWGSTLLQPLQSLPVGDDTDNQCSDEEEIGGY